MEKTERGPAQIYAVPPIISGTLKAMNFEFGRNIRRLNPSKRPLKNFGDRGHGRFQGLPNFLGTPY